MGDNEVKVVECNSEKCLALNMAKENKRDIEALKDEKENSNIAVAILATKFEAVERTITDFGIKLDTIIQKPAKRWDGLVTVVIAAIVGGAISIFLANL